MHQRPLGPRRAPPGELHAALGRHSQSGADARTAAMNGLLLDDISVDGCVTKAPGGGQVAGRSLVDRGKQGMKLPAWSRATAARWRGSWAGANRHDSPLLGPTLDKLADLGPLPETITVHLDAGYDSDATRELLAGRDLVGEIARKGNARPAWRDLNVPRPIRRGVPHGCNPGSTPLPWPSP